MMADVTISVWLGLAGLSLILSFAVLWLLALTTARPRARAVAMPAAPGVPAAASFLFRDQVLLDHDGTDWPPEGEPDTADASDWLQLRDWLGDRFAPLPEDPRNVAEGAPHAPAASDPDDTGVLRVSRNGLTLRVTLHDPAQHGAAAQHVARCRRRHLNMLATALDHAPHPVWITTRDHAPRWQNIRARALPDSLRRAMGTCRRGPPAPGQNLCHRPEPPQTGDAAHRHYEVETLALDDLLIHHAVDITGLLQADAARRDLVQTLTKTFANLTTGLAIFDRRMQLALFNPALLDLTGLPPDFLAARPGLMAFFDSLRDRQVMPEPKDYANWRAQITQMIVTATATDGVYQETWSLPNGLTYRVTGRPHPDGAVAFLFEDISADVSLARGFRAQLDLRETVLDRLDDAVAVISSDQVLIFCNKPCRDLLGVDPDAALAEMHLADLLLICRRNCPGKRFWDGVEGKITGATTFSPISGRLTLPSGRVLKSRIMPMSGGGLMLCFSPDTRHAPVGGLMHPA